MRSLFTWRGSVNLPSRKVDEPERAINYLIAPLRRYSATDIWREQGIIQFNAGMFRGVSNLNPLNGIGRGKLVVNRNPSDVTVRYELDFSQLAIVSLSAGVIIVLFTGRFEGITAGVIAGPIVCAIYFMLGFTLTIRSIPKLVRRAGLGLES